MSDSGGKDQYWRGWLKRRFRCLAEERVRASERRVGELLRAGGGALVWEEMERLRLAPAHLESVDPAQLALDLRGEA